MPPTSVKRCSQRIKRRLSVRFGEAELEHIGYTADFSPEGLFIGATTVYRSGITLRVQLTTREGGAVLLDGEVRWSKKMPAQYAHKIRSGMGVRIIDIVEGRELYQQLCGS